MNITGRKLGMGSICLTNNMFLCENVCNNIFQAGVAQRGAHHCSQHSWSWTHRQNRTERRYLSSVGAEIPPGKLESVFNLDFNCCSDIKVRRRISHFDKTDVFPMSPEMKDSHNFKFTFSGS